MHYLFGWVLGGLIVFSSCVFASGSCDNPKAEIKLTGKSCDNGLKAPEVSCYMPEDVEGNLTQSNYNTVQRAADIFSWQQLIALNWPASAGKRGEPDSNKSVNDSGPRVWETWKEAYEVYGNYIPHTAEPVSWNTSQPLPTACQSLGQGKMLIRTAKVSDVVDLKLQALPVDKNLLADLKDQQGRLLRYEIRMNKPLFEYIVKNKLNNGKAQAKWNEAINFPVGSQLVKAAWRELDDNESEYFLSTDACVCELSGDGKTPSDCKIKSMGLAGFHLMTKTKSAPQWIWSSYEQVDNIHSLHSEVTSLNDANCSDERCKPNMQTAEGIPTQLSREIPIPDKDPECKKTDLAVDNIVLLNKEVHKAPQLKGSFLRYYKLLNTQWPIPDAGEKGVNTSFKVRPEILANTTMESFSQKTSSCMGCHAMSRTLNPNKYISADFSFTLNNATPVPKWLECQEVEASKSCSDTILNPPTGKAITPWEKENWTAVKMGYSVATKTYEVVGSKNVGNRLHCASCHLDAGGNPEAAWWVDMNNTYSTRVKLQDRINGCFERSMNGHKLCSTKNGSQECNKNPIMKGLITYMTWLSKQYRAEHPKGKAARGYPHKVINKGKYKDGHEVYTQKCAFCHNREGEGRYGDHAYFRPALWGPESYNACSGFDTNSSTLASFLKSNMPYTSGGMLSDQEAADLSVYVDGQCRPGKGGVGPNGKACSFSPNCVNGKQVVHP